MTMNKPIPDTFEDTPQKDRDPDWFKRAVFYEVLVRSFQDSDGDGIGDLKGLTAKLDYLQWLGIDCIWLPPFFKRSTSTRRSTNSAPATGTRPNATAERSPPCSASSTRSVGGVRRCASCVTCTFTTPTRKQ